MAKSSSADDLYRDRPLSALYPDLDALSTQNYVATRKTTEHDDRVAKQVRYLDRAIGFATPDPVMVVGCGPRPDTVRILKEMGFAVTGVEPVVTHVASANALLGEGTVVQGTAEHSPVADASQRVVLAESVLEHVDSPDDALRECFRVLQPGGAAFITTTNRFRVKLNGDNGEFNVPFLHWFPPVLRESYVHKALHYEPSLSNYSPRPAVHWFSFADLCTLGRRAGFAVFYHRVDLADPEEPSRSWLKRRVIALSRTSPLVRSAVLVQTGGWIVMVKRA